MWHWLLSVTQWLSASKQQSDYLPTSIKVIKKDFLLHAVVSLYATWLHAALNTPCNITLRVCKADRQEVDRLTFPFLNVRRVCFYAKIKYGIIGGFLYNGVAWKKEGTWPHILLDQYCITSVTLRSSCNAREEHFSRIHKIQSSK